jgi:hypothetical protein
LDNGLNYQCTADFENLGNYFCFWANYFMGHFSGYFEGASTFLTHELSLTALWTIKSKKSWPPQNILRNGPQSNLPAKKIISRILKISGTLIVIRKRNNKFQAPSL